MTKLDQARDQVFYAELTAQLATARQRATGDRERLVRLLGLWGSDLQFRIPAALAPLPPRPKALGAVEVEAVRRRVDLQVVRIELELLAKSYGLTKATRFINLLEVAGISKTVQEPGNDRFNERGVGVELQVPLFDFGEVRVRQAEETYLQAVNRLTAKAVTVRSEAREAYQAYRSTYDIARHYQREVLPLRKIISDETLLRYNAMQIDVFALLAEARQRIASTAAAIEAERDFWLADANLSAAIAGGGTLMDDGGGTPMPQTRTE
jgi:outer membrane protein TolC